MLNRFDSAGYPWPYDSEYKDLLLYFSSSFVTVILLTQVDIMLHRKISIPIDLFYYWLTRIQLRTRDSFRIVTHNLNS